MRLGPTTAAPLVRNVTVLMTVRPSHVFVGRSEQSTTAVGPIVPSGIPLETLEDGAYTTRACSTDCGRLPSE